MNITEPGGGGESFRDAVDRCDLVKFCCCSSMSPPCVILSAAPRRTGPRENDGARSRRIPTGCGPCSCREFYPCPVRQTFFPCRVMMVHQERTGTRVLEVRRVRERRYRENSLRPHGRGRTFGILRLRANDSGGKKTLQ